MQIPRIEKLFLARFRSIRGAEVELENPTFLVGQNGSGKSNLVDAIAFLAEAMASPLQAVFDRRGGISSVRHRSSARSRPPHMAIGVVLSDLNSNVLSARYAFEIAALKDYRFEVRREQCVLESADGKRVWYDRKANAFDSNIRELSPAIEPNALALPVVGGHERFSAALRFLSDMRVYHIEPAKLREMQDPEGGIALRPDGSNAASVLREIERRSKDEWKRLCEILEAIVPQTKSVRAIRHGNKLSLEFVQEWESMPEGAEDLREAKSDKIRFEAFNMSDGTLRALGLLAAVYQQPKPTVLVVEEPEATIHPGALGTVLDLLRHASRQMQVIATTHSPEALDTPWIEDRHLRIVTWHQGATCVAPVSESSRRALQDHLMGAGELLRANALTPAAEMFMEKDNLQQLALFADVGT